MAWGVGRGLCFARAITPGRCALCLSFLGSSFSQDRQRRPHQQMADQDTPLINAARIRDKGKALAETKRILGGIDKGDMAKAVNARGEV